MTATQTSRKPASKLPRLRVRAVTPEDASAWLGMRVALWPDSGSAAHASQIEEFFAGKLREPLQVLIAVADDDRSLGFAELSIRVYAEGCVTDSVGYLEGWYVLPDARRRGVGRALITAAENWARAQGCTEFGSDALIDDGVSAAAHHALGFEEVAQVRCFRKDL